MDLELNAEIKNRPGISPSFHPPVPHIFYKAFISQAWRAGEVIGHTLKTPSDFPRAQMAWQLYPSSQLIPLPCYSSLFFLLLQDHSSSHMLNSSVLGDGEPEGIIFPPLGSPNSKGDKNKVKMRESSLWQISFSVCKHSKHCMSFISHLTQGHTDCGPQRQVPPPERCCLQWQLDA